MLLLHRAKILLRKGSGDTGRVYLLVTREEEGWGQGNQRERKSGECGNLARGFLSSLVLAGIFWKRHRSSFFPSHSTVPEQMSGAAHPPAPSGRPFHWGLRPGRTPGGALPHPPAHTSSRQTWERWDVENAHGEDVRQELQHSRQYIHHAGPHSGPGVLSTCLHSLAGGP